MRFIFASWFCLLIVFSVVFVNGMTDAPNAVGGAVASGVLRARAALRISATLNFLGVALSGVYIGRVTKAVCSIAIFDGEFTVSVMSAALLTVVCFALIAWVFGIPTSESHALIAALCGGAVCVNRGFAGTFGQGWGSVIEGFFVSTLGGALISFLLALTLKKAKARGARFFGGFQVAGAALNSFIHGVQDGQKFAAIIMLCVGTSRGPFSAAIFIAAISMAAGTLCGGGRILKRLCFDMVKLDTLQGFAVELGGFLCLLVSTVLGMPVSTTHAKTAALVGASASKGISSVRGSDVLEISLTWVFTFPCCFAISYILTFIFSAV